jgi:hypothetical protein
MRCLLGRSSFARFQLGVHHPAQLVQLVGREVAFVEQAAMVAGSTVPAVTLPAPAEIEPGGRSPPECRKRDGEGETTQSVW